VISKKFRHLFKRFIALWIYIKNTPILFLSFFSIFITIATFKIYRSVSFLENYKNFLLFTLLIPLISILAAAIYIWYFSRSVEGDRVGGKQDVQILFLALVLGFRLVAVFSRDYRISRNIESFTGPFESKTIQILDIDRSRGDIQEITYEYEGVRGVGYVDWFENLRIGDVCNAKMEIKIPENFSDFDYVRYLKNKNVYFTSPRVEIGICSYKFSPKKLSDIFLWLKRNLRNFRNKLSKRVESYLPEPQDSLLIGILFGSERAFCEQFEEQLRVSGTTHIIAASGYNVTILILAISKILAFIKKKQRLVISLFLIWIYCILSGLGASIVRATMMGSITILALLTGNVRNTHLLIPSGVFFLILFNPKMIFDVGFQLSILATLGLIYVLPSIEEVFKRMDNLQSVPQFLEENLLGTISCTLSTLPISISIFGKLSLVSVFANVLVLPLTESTMLYGTIALLSAFVIQKLSEVLFSTPYIQLKIFQWVVEYFGSIEWGYVDVKTGWIGWLIGVLLFIFCIYFYPLDQESYYVKRLKDL
jgi:ComEC/Rec2-related protein